MEVVSKLEDVCIKLDDFDFSEVGDAPEERYPSRLSAYQTCAEMSPFITQKCADLLTELKPPDNLLDVSIELEKGEEEAVSFDGDIPDAGVSNCAVPSSFEMSGTEPIESVFYEILAAENNPDNDATRACPLAEKEVDLLHALSDVSVKKSDRRHSETFSVTGTASVTVSSLTKGELPSPVADQHPHLETSLSSVQAKKRASDLIKMIQCESRMNRVRNIVLTIEHLSAASVRECHHLVEKNAVGALYAVLGRLNRSYASLEVMSIVVKCLLNISAYAKFVPYIVDEANWLEKLTDFLPSIRDSWHEMFVNIMVILKRVAVVYDAQVAVASDERRVAIWKAMSNYFDRVVLRMEELESKNEQAYVVERIQLYRSKLDAMEGVFAAYSLF